ncbi:MAG TPA: C1 family peptidase [Bacteroidales bacterium]|nr:C1 family peptidase [Bacteroidales bacterium]
MKRIIFILIFILISSTLLYNQSLDDQTINKIRTEYQKQAENDIAVRNALSNNDIKSVSLNRDVCGKTDHNFKYRVKVSGITDQKSSGRCWMFTGLNSLRPMIIESANLSGFEFSTNYLFFWDMLEKSNLFLEATIQNANKDFSDKTVEWLFKNPIGDGGVWNSFANIIAKYGVVPKTVMPETYHSENTSWLNRILSRKLREYGLRLRELKNSKATDIQISQEKFKMISEIYRLLVLFLGEPPTEFTYRFVDKDKNIGEYATYTPLDFFKLMIPDYDKNNYVMLMNDPSREYYKVYEIEYDRNVLEGENWKFLNLPANEIKIFALESIKNNESMYASCDVGKQLNKDDGSLDINNYDFESLLGTKFGMNKAERIKTFDSGSTHAMLLIACDTDDSDKPVKWQFENSWGASYGHNGYLTFTDEWFDNYMFRLVINKKFIDDKTLKLLEQKAIMLPPWDPMFMADN